VSTPASPHYGRYLSAAELADLVAPPAEWVAAVVEWLQSHGVHSHTLSRNRDYITVHVDVGQADALLGCSFGRFLHTCDPHLNANTSYSRTPCSSLCDVCRETGNEVLRCLGEYSVPAHVAPFLDLVAGVIRFPSTCTTCLGVAPLERA
jgi:hypothetical protein